MFPIYFDAAFLARTCLLTMHLRIGTHFLAQSQQWKQLINYSLLIPPMWKEILIVGISHGSAEIITISYFNTRQLHFPNAVKI